MRKILDDADLSTLARLAKEGKTHKEIAAAFGISPSGVCRAIQRYKGIPRKKKVYVPKPKASQAVTGSKPRTKTVIPAVASTPAKRGSDFIRERYWKLMEERVSNDED